MNYLSHPIDVDRYYFSGDPIDDTNFCEVCGRELLSGDICRDCEIEREDQEKRDAAYENEHQPHQHVTQ